MRNKLTNILIGTAFVAETVGFGLAIVDNNPPKSIKYIAGGFVVGIGILYAAGKYDDKTKNYEVKNE